MTPVLPTTTGADRVRTGWLARLIGFWQQARRQRRRRLATRQLAEMSAYVRRDMGLPHADVPRRRP